MSHNASDVKTQNALCTTHHIERDESVLQTNKGE